MDVKLLNGLLLLTVVMWVVTLLSHYLDIRYVKKKGKTRTYTNPFWKVPLRKSEANQETATPTSEEGSK